MALHAAVAVGTIIVRSKPFREFVAYEVRVLTCKKVREKHPDKIPVIVERDESSKNIPEIDKTKFICNGDTSVRVFVAELRGMLKLDSKTALFVFVGDNVVAATHRMMGEVYEKHKDTDGFLYMKYSGENTFG